MLIDWVLFVDLSDVGCFFWQFKVFLPTIKGAEVLL